MRISRLREGAAAGRGGGGRRAEVLRAAGLVTGEPHTALTAFRQRQVLARQGGGDAGPEDLGRPGITL